MQIKEDGSETDRISIRWYIADLKTSFPLSEFYSLQTALTLENYQVVLNGLKNKAKVNGIRLPIFPEIVNPIDYPDIYKKVINEARKIGLVIYASPLSVGMDKYTGWSNAHYAKWLADYVHVFNPDILSPFNEPGINASRIISIASMLRPQLTQRTLMIGPDKQHVQSTIKDLQCAPNMSSLFDVIASHNANKDASATQDNWHQLVTMPQSGNKPVIASENPRPWDSTEHLPGIGEAVKGGVQGIVIWMAKPNLIDDLGRPTQKARIIAAQLSY